MAHRRKYRRHARKNPLGDTTTIVIAVGVTAAVVGVGYYLYRRQQGLPMFGGATAPQLAGQGGVQSTPAPNTPTGASTPPPFKLGDVSGMPQNTPNTPPPQQTSSLLSPVMATRAVATPTSPTGVHAPRYIGGSSLLSPMFDNPNP